MPYSSDSSRRKFIKQSSLGLGTGFLNFKQGAVLAKPCPDRLPQEIIVSTIDVKDGYRDDNAEQRLNRVIRAMKNVTGIKPDLICIPEGFTHYKTENRISLNHVAQQRSITGPLIEKIAAFASENKCYVSCPVITRNQGNLYSSTVIIGRDGRLAGIYNKMHPSKKEMLGDADGYKIMPGAIDQPLIKTDFGVVGVQMGNDIYHSASWNRIAAMGAKIFLYSSTFTGGRMLNYHAISNHCYVISSTISEGRIIDISGNDIDKTSEFIRYSWSRLNTERTNILTFPNRIPALFKKYGNRLRLKVWGNNDMLTIESLDPALKVRDVLNEFQLQTYAELIAGETEVQNRYRKSL